MFKKIFFVVFFALFAVSCSSDDDHSPTVPEQDIEEKNVEFHLFTDKTFVEERWDEAYVKVEIALIKRDNDGSESRVFEKTYDWVHFRDFPKEANKIVAEHDLTYDKNSEVIFASYGVNTRIDDYTASEGTSFSLSPGESTHVIEVKL